MRRVLTDQATLFEMERDEKKPNQMSNEVIYPRLP